MEAYNSTLDHDYARVLSLDVVHIKLDDHIPATFKEAENSPFVNQWYAAISEELESIEAKKVRHKVPRQKNMNVIDTKWVFSCKYSDMGEPIAKARIIPRGFKDTNEYSAAETYAPVAPHTNMLDFVICPQIQSPPNPN